MLENVCDATQEGAAGNEEAPECDTVAGNVCVAGDSEQVVCGHLTGATVAAHQMFDNKVDDLIAILPADWKMCGNDAQQWVIMTQVLTLLGAALSLEKCEFGLTHRVLWHGVVVCLIVGVCSLPTFKVTKAVQTAMWRCANC